MSTAQVAAGGSPCHWHWGSQSCSVNCCQWKWSCGNKQCQWLPMLNVGITASILNIDSVTGILVVYQNWIYSSSWGQGKLYSIWLVMWLSSSHWNRPAPRKPTTHILSHILLLLASWAKTYLFQSSKRPEKSHANYGSDTLIRNPWVTDCDMCPIFLLYLKPLYTIMEVKKYLN